MNGTSSDRETLEIGDRSVDFEHGMLLLEGNGCRGTLDWCVVLLRASPFDVSRLTNDPPRDVAVLRTTATGRFLAGRADAMRFRAYSDGLRLIGTTPRERVDN